MWQTEGPTRVLALMWAWTCGAQAARGKPVCSFGDSEGDGDGVRRRQGSHMREPVRIWMRNVHFILRKMVKH